MNLGLTDAAAAPIPKADDDLTPAMRQYADQKRHVGDALLLFRMGDFYELFHDDARTASKTLGIALTSRDGGTPMAGVPHHALEGYLSRLVAAGFKVAISEQMEDARFAKGVIKRAVVRVVTPGTLTDDALLDARSSNILAAVCDAGPRLGLACIELTSGDFHVQLTDDARLIDELSRVGASELLLPQPDGPGRHPLEWRVRDALALPVTYRPFLDFTAHRAADLLLRQFQVATLEGFGFDSVDESLRAAAAVLAYLAETQRHALPHLRPPQRRAASQHLDLDAVTLRSLEVERTLRSGDRNGTLLAAVDHTRNPMGARLLRHWLCFPLRDVAAIRRRQSVIAILRDTAPRRSALREHLAEVGDVERRIARVAVNRTHPRELRALGNGLARLAPLRTLLRVAEEPLLDDFASRFDGLDDLAQRLCSTLRPDAPIAQREGGIIAEGVDPELDRLRHVGDSGQRWVSDYQDREQQRTGIPNLKVGFNKIFGFYIEITHSHRDRVPPDYVRRQTVKNAERYITDELKKYETDVLSAASRANELEYDLFCRLRDHVAAHIPGLQSAAAAVAELDVLAGWAELAVRRDYCRPEFADEPILDIADGRHPVVEQSHDRSFVANDTRLDASSKSLALITGPNMAGKSTYIRQVALLTLLAHAGAWVPARSMRLGLVDRIFTRVGAADELSRGQSTFMVEMLETANILHNATQRSLVILDEVGRGTSTFDGLALAWAIVEQLATRTGCRALFATHYHELTELENLLDPVFNLNVAVKEFEDKILFLHRIAPGAAGRSYGLHVARLAGIGPHVLERAHAVLSELERSFARESHRPALAAAQRRRTRQLRLFEEPEEAVVRELRELPPEITQDGAAALIRKWRSLLAGNPAAIAPDASS